MTWSIAGKTVLVTGATSGIGLEACVQLARMGARIVMVGRDPRKTEAKKAEVLSRSGSKDVEVLLCDFESQKSIRDLAASVRDRYPRLDVLVNNAGGANKARHLTTDGLEATFAVNHLGPYLFTNLLRDVLVRSAPCRVVTVASAAHRFGTMDFDDLGFAKGYSIMKAYARSKLGNVLFSGELARRLEGTGVSSNSLHPGAVWTNIWSGAPAWAKPVIYLFRPFFLSAEKGGTMIVNLVVDPSLEGATGRYFEETKQSDPAPLALDHAVARRLWDVSSGLVHLDD